MQHLEPRIHDCIRNVMNVKTAELVPTTRFIEDLGFDSLDMVELAMNIEDEFDMVIPDDIAAALHTVEALTAHVKQHAPVQA